MLMGERKDLDLVPFSMALLWFGYEVSLKDSCIKCLVPKAARGGAFGK
jgi:hypothetical protein